MTIKERAQVLYDFSHCPNVQDCKKCAASGVICNIRNTREARDAFFRELAVVLLALPDNE